MTMVLKHKAKNRSPKPFRQPFQHNAAGMVSTRAAESVPEMTKTDHLQVEWWSVERLIPYARNARTHSDAQVAQIAGSIKEFGFTNPVLCDEAGGIIAGHGRVLAARQLDMPSVPRIVLTGLTDAQRRAYVIADNKLALNTGWDPELLRLELGELNLAGFDLSLTGFADLELKDIMADRNGGLTDPDDAPAVPAT